MYKKEKNVITLTRTSHTRELATLYVYIDVTKLLLRERVFYFESLR